MLFEPIVTFILKFKYIILFYLAIIIFFYIKRKQLDFQAKIIVLYRMKFGLRFIEKFVNKFREPTILLGYIGVGAGYVGLIFISYVLIKNLVDLVISPAAVSGVSLVLPGVNIPGLGVLPFWYWVIAIFLIALVKHTINSQITLIVVGFTAYAAVLAGISLETSPKILPPIPEYEITTKPSTILSTIYTRLPLRVKNALILFISS